MPADPFWDEASPKRLLWDAYPFKSYHELFPDSPKGTFSTNPIVLQQLAYRPPRPTHRPRTSEVNLLMRHYPSAELEKPPWSDLKTDLLAANVAFATVQELSCGDALRLVDRLLGPKKVTLAATGEAANEPEELYKARMAAHECANAIYAYIYLARDLFEAGEVPEHEPLKGKVLEVTPRTVGEFQDNDLVDPTESLALLAGSLTLQVNVLMEKHEALLEALGPVEEELADVYPGLQSLSGVRCRSHCKAVETFAFNLVALTFAGTKRYAPEGEVDPNLHEDDAIPFSASNWHPTLDDLFGSFPSIDLEDTVHEAIEQEVMDAWKYRITNTSSAVQDNGDSNSEGTQIAYSPPMSKSEMARRITGRRDARAREVSALLVKHEIEHVSGNKWRVRIDKMDASLRGKLESPERH